MSNDAIEHRTVLDDGYVELVDFMGDEDAVVDAARVSFGKRATQYTTQQNDGLRRYLKEHQHNTPFEMVVFKFRVRAPVMVWWHWVRHRMASYNLISGRYVPFTETDVHLPQDWRKQDPNAKQGSLDENVSEQLAWSFNARRNHLYALAFGLYTDMMAAGVAREQARLVIPFAAVYYDGIVQMNASSLAHFLNLRRAGDAQSETRDYADAVYSIVSKTHPKLFPPS